jgi:hypothetical protein
MRLALAIVVAVCAGSVVGIAAAAGRFEPVIVVSDAKEVASRLHSEGVPFDGTFTASLEDARRARRDLSRFVRLQMKSADSRRAEQLRQILLKERAYVWHCGGFERQGSRFLHCSFVRYHDGDSHLRQPRFPVIFDGGTDVGRCQFSLTAGRLVRIEWNGEA